MSDLRTAWPTISLAAGVVLSGITLAWALAVLAGQPDRWHGCVVHFEGNVAGYWCPVAEFRERPPVAP